MKKLLLALALMLPMVVFTACEKDKENEPGNGSGNELVGTWAEDSDPEEILYYQFNADHSGYEWYVVYEEETSDKYSFTWSANGNTLTIVYHEDGDDDAVSLQYSINNGQLTLTNGYEYLTLRRVK